jgi:hypothetical protein
MNNLSRFPPEIIELVKTRIKDTGKDLNTELSKFDECIFEGFVWKTSPEGHRFWNDILVDKKFGVFYEKYPLNAEKPLKESTFPRVMWVTDYPEGGWCKRVVLKKIHERYVSWQNATNFVDSEKEVYTTIWKHGKELYEVQIPLTKENLLKHFPALTKEELNVFVD